MNSILAIITTILFIVFFILYFLEKNKSSKKQVELEYAKTKLLELEKHNTNLNHQIKATNQKYGGIYNIEEEQENLEKKKKDFEIKIEELREKYKIGIRNFEHLKKESYIIKESLDIAEYGMYEPLFDLDSSERYKAEILENKNKQKEAIKSGDAVKCFTNWSVGSSEKQGQIMIRRSVKLTTRAFNGECDSLISKVRWNNVDRYEERIRKTFRSINDLNKSNDIHIQEDFLQMKLEEIRLVHEYKEKKQKEKEDQRLIREQMREEEKARRDFEKALKDAEKEEKVLGDAMVKARRELESSIGEEKQKLEKKLEELKQKLELAESKNQRAKSMAQQTKSGHVYVISNFGSFGENIYKIGMTRRLEPMDRVKELGDASVPFKFDVHAMIYSDNAPKLESELHKIFYKNRVNFVNLRREYFNVNLDEIEKVVIENHGIFEFVKEVEAREYRESLAIRNKMKTKQQKTT